MRLTGAALRNALADAWERWAHRCAALTPTEWLTPTRCSHWDVRALVAHLCPDPEMFERLGDATVEEPAAVSAADEMLRRFNAADGVAHTMADDLAETAVSDARALTPAAVAARFSDSAHRLRAAEFSDSITIAHPVVGSTTLAVMSELALMEATVHLLDLADAVGGVEPSPEALAATRDLLSAVPDSVSMIEVLAGRVAPQRAVPAIR